MFDIYDSQTRIIRSKVADQPTSVKTPLCRLKLLVDALSKSNPFYRRKLIEAGILDSSFLQSIEDIVKLPMTTREELMNNQLSSPPFGENHTYSMDRYIHWHKTSGTNGKPLHWFDTKESWDWWLDCWKTVFEAAEVTSKDRAFFPFSFGPFIGFWTAWDAAGRIGILCFSGSAQNSLQRIKNIIDFGITVICCTPTYALHLADVAKEEGIDLQGSSVEKIIVAGEPGGSIPEIKGLLEKRWGAMVFDHAGATEVGAHSFTCVKGRSLHLNENEFIAEVLRCPNDSRSGDAAGELVITNLGRIGSPVIRYRTGDLVTIDQTPCPCGSPFMKLVGGITSRIDDMVIIRGVNIFPSAVEAVLRRFNEVREFRIEISKVKSLDEISVIVEVDSEEVLPSIHLELFNAFGLRINVHSAPLNTLPRFELKARRFHRS
jgi:phenylacetate-CoA ligase